MVDSAPIIGVPALAYACHDSYGGGDSFDDCSPIQWAAWVDIQSASQLCTSFEDFHGRSTCKQNVAFSNLKNPCTPGAQMVDSAIYVSEWNPSGTRADFQLVTDRMMGVYQCK